MSGSITGEVEMDLALPEQRSGADRYPAHTAIYTQAMQHIANQRGLAAATLRTRSCAVMSASSLGRGDHFVLPGGGINGLGPNIVTSDPRHERGAIAVGYRHPLGFDEEHQFDPYDGVSVTKINLDATGRAPRISADRIEKGLVIADENGDFVEVRDVHTRGFLPSEPVYICGRDVEGQDREFTYRRGDEVPLIDYAPLPEQASA